MISPSPKPDLDDDLNVALAHERVAREAAAAMREKRIADAGREASPLWVFVLCGLVAMVAGAVLGNTHTFFNYSALVREGYVRAAAPGSDSEGPVTREALVAFKARGARIYSSKCNGCHGADGRGDGANFPSLVGSDWVIKDTQKLAMIILNGLQGPTSSGKVYGSGIMPAQGSGLTPEDLAGLMTYLRNNFGNNVGDIVTVDMAKSALEISQKRDNPGAPLTAEELTSRHAVMLPGDAMDPKTMVSPVTLLTID